MYACMDTCTDARMDEWIHMCMYARTYVGIYTWMDGTINVLDELMDWMDGWIDGTNGWDGRMYGMDGWMDGWIVGVDGWMGWSP